MKKQYISPELNLIEFDVTDIITTSNAISGGDDWFDPSDDWWD